MKRRLTLMVFALALMTGAGALAAETAACCCGEQCKCEQCKCDKECKCDGKCPDGKCGDHCKRPVKK